MTNRDSLSRKIGIVALVGPESTGKTTLAQELAVHYNGSFVPEFSREFLEARDGKYTQADLLTIAKGQLGLENEAIQNGKEPIFCDTDVVVVMVWHEFKYNEKSAALEALFKQQPKRKYLLTYPDLPWQNDPLRENPNDLNALFELYDATLNRLDVDYSVVKGTGSARLENAIDLSESSFTEIDP
ncbi:MAG: AAA family ATPase [Flavobacteriales bacterium]|nr:AAA family ATPase [Flavobacteriales bacterium]